MKRGVASGVVYMLLATVLFTAMTALVKFVSARVPTMEVVLWRTVVPIPLLLWLVKKRGYNAWPTRPLLLVRRSIAGVFAMGMSFYGYGRVPLSNAIMLTRTEPILIALLAFWMLGERPGR